MSVWSTDDFITHQSIFQSNFGNLLLPILLRKQKQKKNYHKSLQQFTHYLHPCSYLASSLTKWRLSKPTLPLVPRAPFPSPLTQGHCISNSPLFAVSFHHHINVLWLFPINKDQLTTFSAGLHPFICSPLHIFLISILPIPEPTLPRCHPIHATTVGLVWSHQWPPHC